MGNGFAPTNFQMPSMSSHMENFFALYVQRIHCVVHDQVYVVTLESVPFPKLLTMQKKFNCEINMVIWLQFIGVLGKNLIFMSMNNCFEKSF